MLLHNTSQSRLDGIEACGRSEVQVHAVEGRRVALREKGSLRPSEYLLRPGCLAAAFEDRSQKRRCSRSHTMESVAAWRLEVAAYPKRDAGDP